MRPRLYQMFEVKPISAWTRPQVLIDEMNQPDRLQRQLDRLEVVSLHQVLIVEGRSEAVLFPGQEQSPAANHGPPRPSSRKLLQKVHASQSNNQSPIYSPRNALCLSNGRSHRKPVDAEPVRRLCQLQLPSHPGPDSRFRHRPCRTARSPRCAETRRRDTGGADQTRHCAERCWRTTC